MTQDHKLSIKAAAFNPLLKQRIQFLVECAESEPLGSSKRNQFNMCIEELLGWAIYVKEHQQVDR